MGADEEGIAVANPRGTPVSEATVKPATAQVLKHIGDANIGDRGLSIGTGVHGSQVGKQDAQYATYRTKAGEQDLIVPHSLGRIPSVVKLQHQEITPQAAANSHLAISLQQRNQWTASTFRARVCATVAGADHDVILTFVVG